MAWEGILRALWIFLPAYLANMAPVFVAKLVPSWSAPIDAGHVGKDGKRILGAGKTWRGLAGGALLGGIMALAMAWLAPHWGLIEGWDFGFNGYEYGAPVGRQAPCVGDPADCSNYVVTEAWRVFLFGAVVGFMALVGDAVKSYFKRRTGREGGAPWFPFDQLDFVIFGLLGFVLASALLPRGWVRHALTDDWLVLTTIVILTPALHLLVNRIGFWLGLKKVPW
ncbi:MAG: CDP-archaeol synthase [bacterium]